MRIDRLLELIKIYKLTDKVKFTGAIPKAEVGLFLSQGDVMINTTNYESFGISTMEAAACGLCIVTTDAGELPFLWEDGVDALIVPKNDPAAMAHAVLRILREPELAKKLSMNARKKAENHDWCVIMPLWESTITQIFHSS